MEATTKSKGPITTSLSVNLKILIDQNGLNSNQLAQDLGLPFMTVRRLLSGQTVDPRIGTLQLLANYFDISIDDLLSSDPSDLKTQPGKIKPRFVPILDWQTAQDTEDISELDLSRWQYWQPLTLASHLQTISDKAFALVSRPSMQPRYPHGTIFVIDPDLKPLDGDIVLVRFTEDKQLTLRELVIDPPTYLLESLTNESSTISYDKENQTISGVNVLTLLYNRNHSD